MSFHGFFYQNLILLLKSLRSLEISCLRFSLILLVKDLSLVAEAQKVGKKERREERENKTISRSHGEFFSQLIFPVVFNISVQIRFESVFLNRIYLLIFLVL